MDIHSGNGSLENVLDKEFKQYMRMSNINIDETQYRIRLPEPTNFGTYRQQETDAALLGAYGGADGIPYLSKRFILERYLQLTDDEIITNERMLREEKGLDPDGDDSDLPTMYNPEAAAEMGGLGGEELGGEMVAGGGEELGAGPEAGGGELGL